MGSSELSGRHDRRLLNAVCFDMKGVKPDNILPVAEGSEILVIGFRGSGKYSATPEVCREHGIRYAENAQQLEELLTAQLKQHGSKE